MNAPHTPLRIPETLSAAEIGPYLASLRVQYNLSPLDVSERLHIRLRYIHALEAAQFDQLPGTVYARGYLRTYAEFLGLDAAQVVAQCFPAVPHAAPAAPGNATPVKPAYVPAIKQQASTLVAQWRGLGIAAVVALVAVLLIAQLMGGEGSTPVAEEPSVAPVPESLLASVRTGLMPNARNYDCISGNGWLSCIFADDTTQLIESPDLHAFPEVTDRDIAAMTQPLPEAREPATEPNAAEELKND